MQSTPCTGYEKRESRSRSPHYLRNRVLHYFTESVMSLRTWRTPLLHHAFKHEVKSLTEELPSPHVDDGYLAHEDSKGSIRRLIAIRHASPRVHLPILAIRRIGERVMRAIASEMYEESSSMRYQALYVVSRSVEGLSQRTCVSSNDASGISAQKECARGPSGPVQGRGET